MASTMFGVTSDIYRNRLHTSYDQLEYDEGDKVVYPDVARLRWQWHQPIGGSIWAGQGGVSGAANRLQFIVPANCVTDPHSYRVYFQCIVTGTNTGLANYAHSVFNQLQIRFMGGASAEPEQVLNYNVFCSMLYQFFSTAHVNTIHKSIEGFTSASDLGPTIAAVTTSGGGAANTLTITATGAAQAVTTVLSNINVIPVANARVWNGKSFMLPLNLGLFMSARKMIPNFIMPTMMIEFIMETAIRATAATSAGARVTPSYSITAAQLICQELEVTDEYTDNLRAQVKSQQASGKPIRIDMSSWTSYNIQVPANQQAGVFQQLVTSDITGCRKIMFGLVNTAQDSLTATSGDSINSFTLNNLAAYRFNVGAHYYPDQDIWVNPGNGTTGATTSLTEDSALAYYMNAYAVGALDNAGSDIVQYWGSSTLAADIAAQNNYVFITRTEFDDAGLPSLRYLQKSGQILIRLIFNSTNISTTALNCYVFINQTRSIVIEEGNRCQVING